MKANNLLDQIDEVRIADDCRCYTSYRSKDFSINRNVIRLKHLLETEIDDLYLRDIDETIRSLNVSVILNLTIIVTDQETNASVISSFIEEVDVVRLDVDSCSNRDLLDLHRDLIIDEVESEILDRFDESTLTVKIIKKEEY
jgi:hypothetical protein